MKVNPHTNFQKIYSAPYFSDINSGVSGQRIILKIGVGVKIKTKKSQVYKIKINPVKSREAGITEQLFNRVKR
jgi:hypothetical protein